MTDITLGKPRILDGEWLFQYYFTSMGSARSIRKLVNYLTSNGTVNPKTGRSVTDMAVWFSMWQWAMYNSTKAYEVFNKAMADEGKFYTDTEWDVFLQKQARTCLKKSDRRFNKWLSRIGKKNQMLA